MSRYESTLTTELNVAPSEHQRWVLRLQLASYRSRKGEYAAARSEIAAARARYPNTDSAQIAGYINLSEGICDYFERGAASALIKLRRAKALAAGCQTDGELISLASSWLATAHRVLGQWSSMSNELLSSFAGRGELSAPVLARVAIVIADAWQEVTDYSRAEVWYKIAHKQALECGDDLTIGAMLYNRAAIHIFNMRLLEINYAEIDLQAGQAALESASAENYSKYIHDRSMQWVFDLLNGQLSLLRANFSESVACLTRVRSSEIATDWPAVELVRRADLIRCQSALGAMPSDDALNGFRALLDEFKDRVGHGDLAIACWSINCALQKNNATEAEVFRRMSVAAAEKHQVSQRAEMQALEEFSAKALDQSAVYSKLLK